MQVWTKKHLKYLHAHALFYYKFMKLVLISTWLIYYLHFRQLQWKKNMKKCLCTTHFLNSHLKKRWKYPQKFTQLPKSACACTHFLLSIVFLTMWMNFPAKTIEKWYPAIWKKLKYEQKCKSAYALAIFLPLIVFLTKGMNSLSNTHQLKSKMWLWTPCH